MKKEFVRKMSLSIFHASILFTKGMSLVLLTNLFGKYCQDPFLIILWTIGVIGIFINIIMEGTNETIN